MTTPIQPAAALPTVAQPAATSPQKNSEWQQFYDWFAYGIVPGSGSTPSSSQLIPTTVPAAPAAAQPTQPAATTPAQPAQPATSTSTPDLWETSVTGTGPFGSTSVYNPTQFATAQTAQQMAQIVGGQEQDFTLGGPYTTSSPIREIVGAGDNPLNAGLVADLFQKYGDQQGSYAWTVIDRDLGKTQG
jgi:hypothetical protein